MSVRWSLRTEPRVALDLRLAAYRAGGITRYATELLAALRGLDIPRLAICELRSARDANRGGVRLRTPPHHRLERWALPAELLLQRVRPDVFHAVDFIAPPARGARVVATVHDLSFLERPQDLAPDALAWYSQLERSRRWTDAWIVPSRWTAEQLAARYGIDPATISVVPHGVPAFLRDVVPLPRATRGGYILAAGTVEPRKRLELLLDAWPQVGDELRLVVAGPRGWNADGLEARIHATPGVERRMDVDDAEMRDLYRHAVALAFPSWMEGFGLPALEAMACGTPVLSSGAGALPEVTGNAAITPDPDAAAWSEAITQIASDEPTWTRLATAGVQRAAEFRWDRAATQTAAVYLGDARSSEA